MEIRLNLGCGPCNSPGWVNIDNSPTVLLCRLPIVGKHFPQWPREIIRMDVTKKLKFADNAVDYVYSSHVFEHIPRRHLQHAVCECYRVLRPGGILRIAVPDLKFLIDRYIQSAEPLASFQFVDALMLRATWRDVLHRGATHSQMFDARSLIQLFEIAGFGNPRPREYLDSAIPDIAVVEPERRAHETLYVEASK